MALQMTASRHHPALVALHWLLAIMLMVALAMGTFVLSGIPMESPEKIGALRGHMVVGVLIGFLMLVRLVVRLRTRHQLAPSPSSGNPLLDALGTFVHLGLYALVFAMAASGMATALVVGLPEIVFGGAGGVVPANLATVAPRIAHGWIAKGIAALVVLHVLGAVFHQAVRKDGLMARMWWGPR
jgi:cytochrome b561